MKKFISISLVLCFFMVIFSPVSSFGDEKTIRPPQDLDSLFDKKITLRDEFGGGATFHCQVIGISGYFASMGTQIVLTVAGLDYRGEAINKIFYTASTSEGEGWHIITHGAKEKMIVLSIE